MPLSVNEIWNIALAVVASMGGGGLIVLALSSWLGKVWADRLLEREGANIQRDFAELKARLDKSIHAHNVAASRIDFQRVEAIRHLYAALIGWHEAALEIVAPSTVSSKPHHDAITLYDLWGGVLREKSEVLEKVSMQTAIFFSEETYQLIAKCGMSASLMSIRFLSAIKNNSNPNTPEHLQAIEAARSELQEQYDKDYVPARMAVLTAFRRIVDPNTPALAEHAG